MVSGKKNFLSNILSMTKVGRINGLAFSRLCSSVFEKFIKRGRSSCLYFMTFQTHAGHLPVEATMLKLMYWLSKLMLTIVSLETI